MVTNVLRHAYECAADKPIEVAFKLEDETFEVVLRDQGPEFDPLEHDTVSLEVDESMPTEAGGFGIYIAKMVMDEVSYERVDDRNELRMRKFARSSSRVQ